MNKYIQHPKYQNDYSLESNTQFITQSDIIDDHVNNENIINHIIDSNQTINNDSIDGEPANNIYFRIRNINNLYVYLPAFCGCSQFAGDETTLAVRSALTEYLNNGSIQNITPDTFATINIESLTNNQIVGQTHEFSVFDYIHQKCDYGRIFIDGKSHPHFIVNTKQSFFIITIICDRSKHELINSSLNDSLHSTSSHQNQNQNQNRNQNQNQNQLITK